LYLPHRGNEKCYLHARYLLLPTCPVRTSYTARLKSCPDTKPKAAFQETLLNIKLTDDQVKKLDDVSALPPEYPGWMIPFQNMNRLADVPRV